MTSSTSCKIKIFNKSYDIKCPEGEEQNLLLAEQKLKEVIQKTKDKFKKLDDYQVLLLAALDVSHELIICKHAQKNQYDQVTQFITSLEQKINKTVSGEGTKLT